MYSFPSISLIREPFTLSNITGSPPTLANARTGDDTPPGISVLASAKTALDLSLEKWRCMGLLCMNGCIPVHYTHFRYQCAGSANRAHRKKNGKEGIIDLGCEH